MTTTNYTVSDDAFTAITTSGDTQCAVQILEKGAVWIVDASSLPSASTTGVRINQDVPTFTNNNIASGNVVYARSYSGDIDIVVVT